MSTPEKVARNVAIENSNLARANDQTQGYIYYFLDPLSANKLSRTSKFFHNIYKEKILILNSYWVALLFKYCPQQANHLSNEELAAVDSKKFMEFFERQNIGLTTSQITFFNKAKDASYHLSEKDFKNFKDVFFAADRYQIKPLQYAVWAGNQKFIDLSYAMLTQYLQDPDNNDYDLTSIQIMCGKNPDECTKAISVLADNRTDEKNNALLQKYFRLALEYRNEKVLTFLITSKIINANARVANGKTALAHVATLNDQAMCDFLLDHDADADALCRDNVLAIHHASRAGNLKIVLLLLSKMKNLKLIQLIDNDEGKSILHFAINNPIILNELLQKKVGSNFLVDRKFFAHKNLENRTPLTLAIFKLIPQSVAVLKSAGAKLDKDYFDFCINRMSPEISDKNARLLTLHFPEYIVAWANLANAVWIQKKFSSDNVTLEFCQAANIFKFAAILKTAFDTILTQEEKNANPEEAITITLIPIVKFLKESPEIDHAYVTNLTTMLLSGAKNTKLKEIVLTHWKNTLANLETQSKQENKETVKERRHCNIM